MIIMLTMSYSMLICCLETIPTCSNPFQPSRTSIASRMTARTVHLSMAWASEKLLGYAVSRCSAVQPRIGSGTTIFEIFDNEMGDGDGGSELGKRWKKLVSALHIKDLTMLFCCRTHDMCHGYEP